MKLMFGNGEVRELPDPVRRGDLWREKKSGDEFLVAGLADGHE